MTITLKKIQTAITVVQIYLKTLPCPLHCLFKIFFIADTSPTKICNHFIKYYNFIVAFSNP